MVLEHIFPEDWLEQKGRYAFLLGVIYTIVGILISYVLFPGDPALVAVAFTSMLLLPELYKIFSIEERRESIEKKVSLLNLWRDDLDIVKIYVFFILALLSGDGAIFLITWNASVWGTIFGFTAKNAALFSGESHFLLFAVIMLVVFPHMIIEGLSYFMAAISGSIISKDVLLEEFASERFFEVFGFNLYLLLFGLVFLVVGALVETFVLQNVAIYQDIIRMSVQAVGL